MVEHSCGRNTSSERPNVQNWSGDEAVANKCLSRNVVFSSFCCVSILRNVLVVFCVSYSMG